MILMSVCDDKPFDTVKILLQISDIRYDQIDPQHVIFRKSQSAVNNNNRILIFKRSDIHADCLKSAERYNLEFLSGICRRLGHGRYSVFDCRGTEAAHKLFNRLIVLRLFGFFY